MILNSPHSYLSGSHNNPYLLFTTGQDLGVIGLQTNDILLLADRNVAKKKEEKLCKTEFLTKEREELTKNNPIKFNGKSIMMKGNSLALTQEQHCQNLKTVSSEAENLTSSRGITRKMVSPKEQYIAQRARGVYIAIVCQPEATIDLSLAAQVTNPMKEDVRKLNKRLMWQKDNSSRGLNFIPLKAPFKLVIFTDYSSQIGYVIVLADKNNKANILHWSSTKCKQVTRSTLAFELYGMANSFDVGAAIKGTIEKVMKLESLPLILFTDSKYLYDCLVKLGTTHKKRLMVDIICLRQSYKRCQITEVIWIDRGSNSADAMTKNHLCQALPDLINSNTINLKAAGWVDRAEGEMVIKETRNKDN